MLLRAADAVLVNGASGVRYLEGLGVAREKIFLHPYCAEIAPNLEIPLDLEPNVSRRFLYVGRLIELKGLIPFLKALSEWLRNHPENKCEFWIAGDGPIRAELEAYPIPPQLQVRFLGSIGYDNLPGVYAQAGILAFPTLGDEWGVVVNEALAAGVPVLGSLYSQAVEELVRDDVNGWTFWTDHPGEMYSAIDRAMNTQNQALEEMRYAGREYIRKFSPEYGAKCFVKAIDFVERPITTARLAHPASNATSAISTVMKTCPLCKREVIRRFELGHTIVYQCAAAGCRLLFSDPQLDDSELARAYERHYYPSTGNGNGNGNKSIYENTPEEILIQTFERLNSQFGPLAGKNLLDYGCGIGRLCQIASRYGARATGIESDGNARKKVMQIGGIEVFENLNELRHVQPRAKFDIVTLWDVIEHLRKPWIELEELFNFLKPGGLLLLSTMNTGCLRARIERGRWVNMVNPTHFYYFTRQSLSAVLEEAGFGHITELPVSIDYPQHGPVQRMFNRVLKSCHLQGQLIYTAQREPAERTERLRTNV
jgi:2-polyprenyl-3-methyl-5-hydroxy-6-metoxy-1,4-benzoquinol methylase